MSKITINGIVSQIPRCSLTNINVPMWTVCGCNALISPVIVNASHHSIYSIIKFIPTALALYFIFSISPQ